MLTVAVVEDDPDQQRTVVGYLHDFLAGREAYTCTVYDDGAGLLAADAQGAPAQPGPRAAWPDILILDIVMRRSNGLEVARRLREQGATSVILFVTEAVQYALEGYGVHAADFLVKPLYYTSFCSSMQRALTILQRRAPTMVRVGFDKTCALVDVASVLYVETRRKGTVIHTRTGELSCSDSMAELERRLEPHGFGRCHQGFLVNLACVESVRRDEVLVGGQTLPLSRRRRADFIERLVGEVGAVV